MSSIRAALAVSSREPSGAARRQREAQRKGGRVRAILALLLLATMTGTGCVGPTSNDSAAQSLRAAEAGTGQVRPTSGAIVRVSPRGGDDLVVCVDFDPQQSPLQAERCLFVDDGTRLEKGRLAIQSSELAAGQEVDVWMDMTHIADSDPPQVHATRIRVRA